MSDHMHNESMREDAEPEGRPSRRTELLRAGADAELSEAEREAFEAHLRAHPEDRAVVEFERSLRAAIRATPIEGPTAGVRARIERMRSVAPGPPAQRPLAGGHRRLGGRLTWLALAAAVALAGGVAYTTAFVPQARPAGAERVNPAHRAALVSFVRAQHDECELHAQLIARRFRIGPYREAPGALSGILGVAPDLGQMEAAGVRFLGAAECAVPGRGTSVHVVFDAGGAGGAEPGGRTALVSLFVQQDRGELALEAGRTYRMVPNEGDAGPVPLEVFVWRKEGLVYFLISTSASELDAVRTGLGAAEPTGAL